jgi:hypothetical protein
MVDEKQDRNVGVQAGETLKFDLLKEVEQSFVSLVMGGGLRKMLDVKIEKAVESVLSTAIDDLFGYNGEVRGTIRSVMKKQIQISEGDFTIPSYRQTILNQVRDELSRIIDSFGAEKAKKAVESLLSQEVPMQVEFKDLVMKLKEDVFAGYVDKDKTEGKVAVFIDEEPTVLAFIHMDEDEIDHAYSCDHRLVLSPIKEEPGFFRIQAYEYKGNPYNTKIGFGMDVRRFGDYLFRLYSVGAKIHYVPEEMKAELGEWTRWERDSGEDW